MLGRYKIKLNGKVIGTSDEPPYLIIDEPINNKNSKTDFKKLQVSIPDKLKNYKDFRYTTDFNTFKLIIENKTFRSTSLQSAKLNDQFEKQRVGVESFAGGRFITCFSHYEKEQEYMWKNYGDTDHPENNVQLVFKNFALNFDECFYTDFVWLNNCSEKLFCNSTDYWNLVKRCTFPILDSVPEGCTINNCVKEIKVIDVEYLPEDNDAFTQDYSGNVNLHFGHSDITGINVKGYDPTKLGFQKTNKWKKEHETRILSILRGQENVEWDYIDLRLKDEIFRDMQIIMNPWEKDGFEENLMAVIRDSDLDDVIKKSITVRPSSAKGQINL